MAEDSWTITESSVQYLIISLPLSIAVILISVLYWKTRPSASDLKAEPPKRRRVPVDSFDEPNSSADDDDDDDDADDDLDEDEEAHLHRFSEYSDSGSDSGSDDEAEGLDSPGLVGKLKTARLKQIEKSLSPEQKENEKEIEREQMAAILDLLRKQEEQFQMGMKMDEDEVRAQLNLYK